LGQRGERVFADPTTALKKKRPCSLRISDALQRADQQSAFLCANHNIQEFDPSRSADGRVNQGQFEPATDFNKSAPPVLPSARSAPSSG
jgi:hypothetical protein